MTEQELREKMTIAMGQCYSQELSACPSHPIFQPQKAINLMLVLIKEANYVRLADDQSLPDSPYAEASDRGDMHAMSRTSGYYCSQQDMLDKGFKRVEL